MFRINRRPLTSAADVPSPRLRERLESVDALRGIAMVLMALDHTRGFLSNAQFAPVDLAHTTPALFFTRWVTHFCAPAFFLLAGVGASLSLARGRSLAQVSRFFLTRGLWLVVLELTLVCFGWDFTLHVTPWYAGVIWALGWSMVFMAALAWLPRGAIAAVGIALIVLHNVTDAMTPAAFGEFGWLWRFLHFPDLHASLLIRIDYPIIPWVGVMAVGYAMGPLFRESPERRQKILVGLGVAAVIGFLGLRWLNGYGDPMPWSVETRGTYTVLSFLRVRKYPPSLDYLLMTLGPLLIALVWLEHARGRVFFFFVTYGRVPLLFYVAHIYLVHLLAVVVAYGQGGTASFLFTSDGPLARHPPWYGVNLVWVYVGWVLVVIALYPMCRAFARVKARRRDWWLSYL
jgi:uncharacterized membrane protein